MRTSGQGHAPTLLSPAFAAIANAAGDITDVGVNCLGGDTCGPR